MNTAADDSEGQTRFAALQQALQQLGWSDGHNLRIDTRWGVNDVDLDRRYAAELAALAPDVILAAGTLGVAVSSRPDGFCSESGSTPMALSALRDWRRPGRDTVISSHAAPASQKAGRSILRAVG